VMTLFQRESLEDVFIQIARSEAGAVFGAGSPAK